METPVPINEQTPQKENCEYSSEKDSPPVLQKLQGSNKGPRSENAVGDEAPLSSLNESQLAQEKQPAPHGSPVSNDVSTNVSETPVSSLNNSQFAVVKQVSNDVSTTVSETPVSSLNDPQFAAAKQVSNNVSTTVSETPVNSLNDPQSAAAKQVDSSEGAVNTETVNTETVMVDEGSASNSIVVVHDETPVPTAIIRVPPEKRTLYKFGQRTSNFRGVTKHRWTGKFEAHLWDNSTITEGRKRKGKQVYLGGYESEQKAAQAYDLAALKYWGPGANTKLNFPVSTYEKELEEMRDMSREEYVNSLRRKSICFTRGHSIYRGVTRQNEGRRWQARIGRVAGGKDIYLGTYDTEEEAAEAYDIAAVKLRGMNAITNFDISNYYKEGTKELDVIPIRTVEEESFPHLRIRYFKLG